MNYNLSKNVLINLLSKSSTRKIEYSSMTKAEKREYFTSNFRADIERAKEKNVEFTFPKFRVFKYETTTTDENGNKTTKINEDYKFKALSFASIANTSQVAFIVSILNSATKEDIEIPYRVTLTFDKFSETDVDFIVWCESTLGIPKGGELEVETGYGETLHEFLKANGFNFDALK